MIEFSFEREAMKGKQLPKGLDIADSCLYIALKNLYAMYRNKLISRKDATEEKRQLIYNWTTDKSKIEFLNRESEALRDKIAPRLRIIKTTLALKRLMHFMQHFTIYRLIGEKRND